MKMKKLITIFVLCTLSMGLMAQNSWSRFGKVTKGTSATELVKGTGGKVIDWYFQPAALLTAVKWDFNKDEKQFQSSPFTAAGVGIGIQHYATVNDKLSPDYGFDLLLMINTSDVENKTGIGVAGTLKILGLFGLGGGIDITNKHPYLLSGVQISF
jgi:hypothetical protein